MHYYTVTPISKHISGLCGKEEEAFIYFLMSAHHLRLKYLRCYSAIDYTPPWNVFFYDCTVSVRGNDKSNYQIKYHLTPTIPRGTKKKQITTKKNQQTHHKYNYCKVPGKVL